MWFFCRFNHVENREKAPSRYVVLWHALNMAIFPVSYFFTFLYYTEVLSTFLVLLMVDLHLASRRHWASLVGILSCVARQVNIVWVGYLLLHSFSQCYDNFSKDPALQKTLKKHKQKDQGGGGISQNTIRSNSPMWRIAGRELRGAAFSLPAAMVRLQVPVALWTRLGRRLVGAAGGYASVCCLFVGFVALNGGLVVGDRLAHQPVLHLAQIFYFAAFSLLFTWPDSLTKVGPFLRLVKSTGPLVALGCLILALAAVHLSTHVHPYLLADNRHLTFYLWKNILRHSFARLAAVPLYLFSLFCLSDTLRGTNFSVATWAALLLALVPQRLLELRYFVLPHLLCRLHLRPNSPNFLLTETVFNLAVNSAVFCLFFNKQFYWSDFEEPQRIIW